MSAISDAFNVWWDEQARQGDPARKPGLTSAAFEAGYRAAAQDMTMTRDRFAMAALPIAFEQTGPNKEGWNGVAKVAYAIGDAMLKAKQS